jgi:hypothetical protein
MDANWINAAVAAFGLMLAGAALYVDKVYERHRVTLTITDQVFAFGVLQVDALFSNGGNHPVAVIDATVMYELGAAESTAESESSAQVGARIVDEGTALPLVIAPGDSCHYTVAFTFNGAAAWQRGYGRLVAPDRRELQFSAYVITMNSRGAMTGTQIFKYMTADVGADGAMHATLPGVRRPHTV